MMPPVSFRTKMSLTMISLLLLLGVSLALIISKTASEALVEESKKRGVSSAVHVGARIGEPLLARDYLRMKDLVDEAIRTSEDISFVFVLGHQGKPIVHSFINLLNNAHDAIGSDGRVVVATRHDRDNAEVLVSVTDSGCGIPPDTLSKIFDPFFTTKPVGKGTGLGLSVTFGIMEDHGGRIEVESRARTPEAIHLPDRLDQTRGTVFTLHFPVYRASENDSAKNEHS